MTLTDIIRSVLDPEGAFMGILKLRIKKYKVVSFCSISIMKNFENSLKFWISRPGNLRFLSFFVEETLLWNFEEKRCAGRTTNQKRKATSPKFKLKIWWYYIFASPSDSLTDLLTFWHNVINLGLNFCFVYHFDILR